MHQASGADTSSSGDDDGGVADMSPAVAVSASVVEPADEIQVRHDAPDEVLHATAVTAYAVDDDRVDAVDDHHPRDLPIGVSGRHDSTRGASRPSTVVASSRCG